MDGALSSLVSWKVSQLMAGIGMRSAFQSAPRSRQHKASTPPKREVAQRGSIVPRALGGCLVTAPEHVLDPKQAHCGFGGHLGCKCPFSKPCRALLQHLCACHVSWGDMAHTPGTKVLNCGVQQEEHTGTAPHPGMVCLGTASPAGGSSLDKRTLVMAGWKGKLHNSSGRKIKCHADCWMYFRKQNCCQTKSLLSCLSWECALLFCVTQFSTWQNLLIWQVNLKPLNYILKSVQTQYHTSKRGVSPPGQVLDAVPPHCWDGLHDRHLLLITSSFCF